MKLITTPQKQATEQDLTAIPGVFKGAAKATPLREAYPFSQVEGGIPRGALTEISGRPGSGKTEVILSFLAENPSARIAWIEKSFNAYPCAFAQRGVGLERVLFVDSNANSKEALWSAHQIIRSQIFEVVILSFQSLGQTGSGVKSPSVEDDFDATGLRRLQLAAEKSRVSLILLLEEPSKVTKWSLFLQLQVSRSLKSGPEMGKIEIQVLKNRGRSLWQLQTESRACS
ncbi:MAG: hypothetical protein AABZ55_03730 [Bdellovibrionota bacterium]